MANKKTEDNDKQNAPKEKEPIECGIIMPISDSDGYPLGHWTDVKRILEEVVVEAGFKPVLVWESAGTDIIHKTIIQNIFNCPIVVCDVSSKNANVMFELGMRLTFDKPTVIIKDEITGFVFDTSVIEHIIYPSGLHYHLMNDFKKMLMRKLVATYDSDFKFLKNFVEYKVVLEEKEVSQNQFLVEELQSIKTMLGNISALPVSSSVASNTSTHFSTALNSLKQPQTHAETLIRLHIYRNLDANDFKVDDLADETTRENVVRTIMSKGYPESMIRKVIQRLLVADV